ncbi:hypothetical protein ABPG72_002031 [Tetrahymena utriculariae]
MKQRQINNYQAQQEILPLKQLDPSFQNQKHQQLQQYSSIVIQPQSSIHSHRVLDEQNKQISYFLNQEENALTKAVQQNNLQDSKPLILRVKRYKKKLQSVLGNYQQIQYSPKSVLRKDIMFPKLCENKQKRKGPNVSNLSIKVDDREDTPPLQNLNNHNLILNQNSNKVSSSIDQKSLLRNADDPKIYNKNELENQSLYLHEIINNKNDKLDIQLKHQNTQKKESLQAVKQQKQPLESYSQFNPIDVQNNSFIQRNARAISQIEHNRKGQANNSYQAEPVYQQSSKQRYQKLMPQLSQHRESISIDYQQNQTPKQKQIYTSIRHYYPQSSKNSQISIDFEEYFPYKNAQHNSLSVSPNSSSFQLNTLRSSKQSFVLPPSNYSSQIKNIQNTGNFPFNKEQSARSTRQSKNYEISAICDSVATSMQTIPHEDLESSQNKLRSIQVNIFQNQGLKVNKRAQNIQNMQQNHTNQKQLLDSVELLKKKTQNHNKASLDYQYLEDFTVFPENVTFQQQQSDVMNSTRNRQNSQTKNSGKRSGAGQSLPPSSQLKMDTNQQRKSVMSKIQNYPNYKKTEINTNDETDLNKIWNKAQLTNNNCPQMEKVQIVNQSLDLQKGNQNNTTNNTILSTIQSNITSYDEEIKKITQLQQKNYHDLQNYVNIHLDLINIKTQIRIKSSLAGNNIKNNNQT